MIEGTYIVGEEAYTAEKFEALEKVLDVIFPKAYKDFIIEMKGAEMDCEFVDDFEEEFSFSPIDIFAKGKEVAEFEGMISYFFDSKFHEENWSEYMISKSLLFFGSDGAGRYFCFDYALEKDGKVPVVIVMPDADAEERGRYIADDFEQFLEMLGNPEMEAPYYAIEYPYIEDAILDLV